MSYRFFSHDKSLVSHRPQEQDVDQQNPAETGTLQQNWCVLFNFYILQGLSVKSGQF